MLSIAIALIAMVLAYANGANDNFKGVATLFGSRTSSYRRALLWATLATALGSVAALVLARELLAAFSGKGLVAPEVLSDPAFPAAVALAAGATVLLATRFGFPVSTTHALIGGLVGAGLVASPTGVDTSKLTSGFAVPLLTSPLLAVVLAGLLYSPLPSARGLLGSVRPVGVGVEETPGVIPEGPEAARRAALATLASGNRSAGRSRDERRTTGARAGRFIDVAHYLSSGAVSFARGLNDTPKIAALLLVSRTLAPGAAIVAVALAIAMGGLVSARRVAETMSHRVTDMSAGQGLAANVVTSLLVVGASNFGMPVSTTHVSCGSLFGIGTVTGRARYEVIGSILLAWVVTLPVAGVLGACFVYLLDGAL